jgi:hypothetical protein
MNIGGVFRDPPDSPPRAPRQSRRSGWNTTTARPGTSVAHNLCYWMRLEALAG